MRTHIYNRLLLLLPYSLSRAVYSFSDVHHAFVRLSHLEHGTRLQVFFDLVLIFEELSEASLAAATLWDQTGL